MNTPETTQDIHAEAQPAASVAVPGQASRMGYLKPAQGVQAASSALSEAEWETLVEQEMVHIRSRGPLAWLSRKMAFGNPIQEIEHEWLIVHGFVDRIRASGRPEIDGRPVDFRTEGELRQVLVFAMANLECARNERDFAQAWTHLNLADAFLPLVVDDKDLESCTARLRYLDTSLPRYYRCLVSKAALEAKCPACEDIELLWEEVATRPLVLGALESSLPMAGRVQPLLEKIVADETSGEGERARVTRLLERLKAGGANPDDGARAVSTRGALHELQLARSCIWNRMNRRVTLGLALWRQARLRTYGLLVAIFAACYVWLIAANGDGEGFRAVLSIFLFGLFGGGLSAFMFARGSSVVISTYERLKAFLHMRVLLGGLGALVVYAIAQVSFPSVLSEGLKTHFYGVMALGIASGFSERLFLNALDRYSSKMINITGSTKQPGKSDEESEELSSEEKKNG